MTMPFVRPSTLALLFLASASLSTQNPLDAAASYSQYVAAYQASMNAWQQSQQAWLATQKPAGVSGAAPVVTPPPVVNTPAPVPVPTATQASAVVDSSPAANTPPQVSSPAVNIPTTATSAPANTPAAKVNPFLAVLAGLIHGNGGANSNFDTVNSLAQIAYTSLGLQNPSMKGAPTPTPASSTKSDVYHWDGANINVLNYPADLYSTFIPDTSDLTMCYYGMGYICTAIEKRDQVAVIATATDTQAEITSVPEVSFGPHARLV